MDESGIKRKEMNDKTPIHILLGLLFVVILFHVAVLFKAVPNEIVWGGRLQDDSEMLVFEALSILINMFLGLVLLMKADYIKIKWKEKTINIILWIFLILFVLNTFGNLFANSNFEKFFAVLTFAFAILIWKILKQKKFNGRNKISNLEKNQDNLPV
ncbi:DUF1616 domain-containing protein [Chryseobacterium sp. R2A-55]|uniref:DUF1616 domain-containing protein n=1 Tax=Chryseobacterium sp. R2A-55 TaxID=2744445 RepID=UPI001F427661|nr:DUF1616 domain-containing protein [Chryseobacterium sp. R2A-55]